MQSAAAPLAAVALTLTLVAGGCVSQQGGAANFAAAKTAEPITEREAAPDYGPAETAAQPQEEVAVSSDGPYDTLIARYAAEEGVPLPLAHAVIEKESGYNARANGAGAVGLMQIKPATARGIGYRGSTSALYDPAVNLEWGMKYLAGAYRLGGGDTCATTLRYQGGHRATRQTSMTRRYCAGIKTLMAKHGA